MSNKGMTYIEYYPDKNEALIDGHIYGSVEINLDELENGVPLTIEGMKYEYRYVYDSYKGWRYDKPVEQFLKEMKYEDFYGDMKKFIYTKKPFWFGRWRQPIGEFIKYGEYRLKKGEFHSIITSNYKLTIKKLEKQK